MRRHEFAEGDALLWQCAFHAPLPVEVVKLDGWSGAGEPHYLVRDNDTYGVEFSLGDAVLR